MDTENLEKESVTDDQAKMPFSVELKTNDDYCLEFWVGNNTGKYLQSLSLKTTLYLREGAKQYLTNTVREISNGDRINMFIVSLGEGEEMHIDEITGIDEAGEKITQKCDQTYYPPSSGPLIPPAGVGKRIRRAIRNALSLR